MFILIFFLLLILGGVLLAYALHNDGIISGIIGLVVIAFSVVLLIVCSEVKPKSREILKNSDEYKLMSIENGIARYYTKENKVKDFSTVDFNVEITIDNDCDPVFIECTYNIEYYYENPVLAFLEIWNEKDSEQYTKYYIYAPEDMLK